MPGLTFSNELISRDEGLHTDFACQLYTQLRHALPAARVYQIVREAVDLEVRCMPSFVQLMVSWAVILRCLGTCARHTAWHCSAQEEFCCEALSVSLVGMNADMMAEYIRFIADRLVVALGYEKLYNASNPFDWMEMISLQCVYHVRTLPLSIVYCCHHLCSSVAICSCLQGQD